MAKLLPIIIGFVLCIGTAIVLAIHAGSKKPDE